MKQEINPQDSPRGFAFELWKTAGMPKVTIFKTFDITRLIKVAKRSGMKTNMLMCWCIGHAASNIEEFYTLPAGGHLWQYDREAVHFKQSPCKQSIYEKKESTCDNSWPIHSFSRSYKHNLCSVQRPSQTGKRNQHKYISNENRSYY